MPKKKPPSPPKAIPISFPDFVAQAGAPLPKVLPLVHMTDALGAREILISNKIEARSCRHFSALLLSDEPLSFFFYGRAAYRPRINSPSKNGATLPVALIIAFDPSQHVIKRIFPFDTGAAFTKLYSPFLHERLKVMDFCLGNQIDAAQKNVATFYETNQNYSRDTVSTTINHDPAQFEVDNYINMIKNTAQLDVDNRKSSIEIQFQEPIDLNKTKILGVVLPETLMDSTIYKDLLKPHSISPKSYVLTGGSTAEYDGVLIAESTKLLRNHL